MIKPLIFLIDSFLFNELALKKKLEKIYERNLDVDKSSLFIHAYRADIINN